MKSRFRDGENVIRYGVRGGIRTQAHIRGAERNILFDHSIVDDKPDLMHDVNKSPLSLSR